jgi:hypothetical protein
VDARDGLNPRVLAISAGFGPELPCGPRPYAAKLGLMSPRLSEIFRGDHLTFVRSRSSVNYVSKHPLAGDRLWVFTFLINR